MKRIVFKFLLIVLPAIVFGQNQQINLTNQTIIRLNIINDEDELLTRETKYGWMTPAIYFNKRQNIHEIIDSLSASYGIKIKYLSLNGLFTYKYEFKKTSDFRQVYLANYESGILVKNVKEEKIHWMPIEKALIKLKGTVPSLAAMTMKVIKSPNVLWGASFILYKVDGKLMSKVEENFYTLTGYW
jgi:hypothetical protein